MADNKSLDQFIKFAVVGVTNTLISYAINVCVLYMLENYKFEHDYIIANVAAFILSVLWAFYWNNKFVFTCPEGEERNLLAVLLKTYIAYGFTGIILANILSYVWIHVINISKYAAPIVNLIISVPLNFVINKKWSYNS